MFSDLLQALKHGKIKDVHVPRISDAIRQACHQSKSLLHMQWPASILEPPMHSAINKLLTFTAARQWLTLAAA